VEADYPLGRDALYEKLKQHGIFARRYFYPLITEFPMYRGLPSAHRDNLPVASDAARKVMCLPIYPTLQLEDQQRIAAVIAGR
jgi:dTDP-4-amino-4,6-dideoxygalactose transaminase